jgi:transcription initiation factor TFIIB
MKIEQKEWVDNASISCSICKEYSSIPITDPDSGEIICSNCGMVICEKLEDNSHQEIRAYSIEDSDKTARTGAPISLAISNKGLSSIISRSNRDASGQPLDSTMRSAVERLRTWDSRIKIHSSEDRNLRRAFQHLDTLKDKLGLSDTMVEKIAYIYRKVQRMGLIRGRSVDGMVTAAVYIVCREMGTPRMLKDIAAISNVKRKDISRNYRVLVFELDIKIPTVDPMKCVVKDADKLSLNERKKYTAMNIMKEIVSKEITAGKKPMSLAATAIYISSVMTGERIPQTKLAAASGITEVTIRNRLKDLANKLNL